MLPRRTASDDSDDSEHFVDANSRRSSRRPSETHSNSGFASDEDAITSACSQSDAFCSACSACSGSRAESECEYDEQPHDTRLQSDPIHVTEVFPALQTGRVRAAPRQDDLLLDLRTENMNAAEQRFQQVDSRDFNGATIQPAVPQIPCTSSPRSSSNGSMHRVPWRPVRPAPAHFIDMQVSELMSRDPDAGVALAMAVFRHLQTGSLAAEALGDEAQRVFGLAPSKLTDAGLAGERSSKSSPKSDPLASLMSNVPLPRWECWRR